MKRHYKDQGGWEGWTWGGMDRECFVFSDSLQVGGSLHVGSHEGLISESDLAIALFAGIVCVANRER